MDLESLERIDSQSYTRITLRDVVAVVFRQRQILLGSFVLILVAVVFSGLLKPTYRAEMKLLVRRGRVDPVVTSQSAAPMQLVQAEVTESELNSEVELLRSQDLLRKVVLATDLWKKPARWQSIFGVPSEEVQIATAIGRLRKQITAETLSKTDVISVSFESSDPERAAKVLNSLASLYLEKHLQVHRLDGEFTFFDRETEQFRQRLDSAEAQLTAFTRQKGVVSAPLERDLTLQKVSDLRAELNQTRAAIEETKKRIQTLERQAPLIPARTTTQLRTADNAGLLQQMKSTLLELQLKHTQLLSKFEPTYRPVQDLEKQISETKAAIARENSAPTRDETTDQNSIYQWVKSELAKAQTDLSGFEARAAAYQAALNQYSASARQLQQESVVQQDLLRNAKTEEENYLLYLRKEEEARINQALDKRGILNVAIVDPPTAPAFPKRSMLVSSLLGISLAIVGSVGLAFVSDFVDPSFRTPDEIVALLEAPVLASIPQNVK